MYAVEGELIDHTIIKLKEPVPFNNGNIRVVIEQEKEKKKFSRKEMFGILKGKIKMSDDFNAPLDCFKEYM